MGLNVTLKSVVSLVAQSRHTFLQKELPNVASSEGGKSKTRLNRLDLAISPSFRFFTCASNLSTGYKSLGRTNRIPYERLKYKCLDMVTLGYRLYVPWTSQYWLQMAWGPDDTP